MPQDMILFGLKSLYRGDQVRMRSLGWVLMQCDWCPHRKGGWEEETHMHRGETTSSRCLHREKTMLSKPGGGAWDTPLPHSPQKEPTLRTPWSWTSSLRNCETIHFLLGSGLVCRTL